ncbi:bifunctional metallophosphatase/5'-nucleotidase [Clostridium thermarum]|uniref:bifunctional metallophosphatase/5'-nucleotidase n=1 Tax=Clostridium thermarum TaxID=1716543 RepID=UPI00112156E6|nr:bifunctional UDP-sugar hydrolase/5'-nucleotidase [Clostridium thermarum]
MKQEDSVRLTIVMTSDIHGNVLPISYNDNSYKPHGLAKIAALVNKIREKKGIDLLIDNGDLIQGTPLTYHYCKINNEGPNPIIEILNYLEYDALIVGNHEFNYGTEILNRAKQEAKFPWLTANILNSQDRECYFGKPYLIKEVKNGIKIGVLGVTTQYIPCWEDYRNIQGLIFEDAVTATQKWVRHLREVEHVDIVIVCYHGGFEKDLESGEPIGKITGENEAYEICQNVEGIDVLLTGHQHRVIENKLINNVLVLQPGSHGKYLGIVNITMQRKDKWKVKSKSSRVEPVKEAAVDQRVVAIISNYERDTQQWLDKPIGTIRGGMKITNPIEARLRETPLVELINKVQMEASGASISCASLFIEDVKSIKEKITMRDIVSNYIYPNTLRVLKVKGRDIKDALERSATYFERYDGKAVRVKGKDGINAFHHYNYDMWEGIEYKINISKEEGNRIEDLKYRGKQLDMEEEYEVVMNNYRAAGGGEYKMFKDKPVIKDIPTDVSELIANYIIERRNINGEVNNNWSVVY